MGLLQVNYILFTGGLYKNNVALTDYTNFLLHSIVLGKPNRQTQQASPSQFLADRQRRSKQHFQGLCQCHGEQFFHTYHDWSEYSRIYYMIVLLIVIYTLRLSGVQVLTWLRVSIVNGCRSCIKPKRDPCVYSQFECCRNQKIRMVVYLFSKHVLSWL